MSNLVPSSNPAFVFVKDGAVFANSQDIAEAFGKEHKHVLDSIDNLAESLMAENSAVGFSEVSEPHPTVPRRMWPGFASHHVAGMKVAT